MGTYDVQHCVLDAIDSAKNAAHLQRVSDRQTNPQWRRYEYS